MPRTKGRKIHLKTNNDCASRKTQGVRHYKIFTIVMTRYWKMNLHSSELLICPVEKQAMMDTEVFMCTIKKVGNIIQ